VTKQSRFHSKSPDETFEIARKFAASLRAGDIVLLTGDLGAGKTCFVQGLANGLNISGEIYVRSPSFALVNEYQGGRLPLFHFDFYRLNDASELTDIGLDDYIRRDGVVAIEWAEKFASSLPHKAYRIRFKTISENEREIICTT
jgi:tRNA threonylcarbamoyladenosine biosynthesis protein TsaE